MGQGDRAAVFQRIGRFGAGKPVIGGVHIHPHGLARLGKVQLPVVKGAFAVQGNIEAGVSADAEVHLPGIPVFHQTGLADLISPESVAYVEGKMEGVHGKGLLVASQGEADGRVGLFGHGKVRADAEAVDGHGVGFSVQQVLPVGQAADVGEQVGVPPRPVSGVALPEVFGTVLDDAVQNGTAGVEGYGQGVVVKGVQVHKMSS